MSLWTCLLACSLPVVGAERGEITELRTVEIRAPRRASGYHPVFARERLESYLRPFVGSVCDPETIAASLSRRYRLLGYLPEIEIGCEGGTLSASIRESNQTIDVISFDAADLARLGVERDPSFQENRGLYPVPKDAPRAVLRGLLETREGDLYNFERYRDESLALRRFGYAIAVVPGTPDGDGFPRAAYLILTTRPPEAPATRERRETNYAGGTASYAPRVGGTVGLDYQKSSFWLPLDRLSVTTDYSAALGGEISYLAPLVASREQPRCLYDLELRLFSDFQNNRLLEDAETDERRSGGAVGLGIRLLDLRAPHALRFTWAVRRERIDLEPSVDGVSEQDLMLVRLGAEYEWLHTFRWPSLSARVVPSVDLALAFAGGDLSFVRPGIDARLHQQWLGGRETDFHLTGGTLNRDVPAFDLWSLGGAATLRGFKEDAFLGRHTASLQSEIWIPFFRPRNPGAPESPESSTASDSAGREIPLFRYLKSAVFLDAGVVSGTQSGENETAGGAGVGLRFLVPRNPLVIRLDYAWGFGAPGDGSYFYFSMGYHR